jgi:hypothetical protein
MLIPLLAPPNEARHRSHSARKLINYYLVQNRSDEEYPYIAYPSPGATLFASITGNSVRGAIEWRGMGYVVIDASFYSVSPAGSVIYLGALNTSTGRVKMATIEGNNGGQMVITDGLNGYLFLFNTNTFTQITDEDFPNGAEVCTSHDERFIVPVPNTSNWQISNTADGSTWQALQVASKRSKDDLLMAPYYHNLYIWLFGEESIETWINTGNEDFTFERQQGLALSYGLSAKFSIAEAGNQLFWLGRNASGSPMVFQSNGFQPTVVSTDDLNYLFSIADTVTDVFSYALTIEGHEWVVFTSPSEDWTYVYDLTTQLWFKWESYNSDTLSYGRHFSNCHMLLGNKHIVGDSTSGNLYQLDFSTYTEKGNRIRRIIESDHMDFDRRMVRVSNLEIKCETGVGLTTGQGSDPQMQLELSKDYGNTWGVPRFRSPGKLGKYKDRLHWPSCGSARQLTIRLETTDPCKWVIHGGRLDITPTRK